MSVQPEHTWSGETPARAVLPGDITDHGVRSVVSCRTESVLCAAGEIVVVLRVEGDVDLCTLPNLRTALDASLRRRPAHLVVDLTRMTFCGALGLDLLTHTGRTATGQQTSYAVSGVAPRLEHLWELLWEGDLPVRYPDTAAAVAGIGAHHAHERS